MDFANIYKVTARLSDGCHNMSRYGIERSNRRLASKEIFHENVYDGRSLHRLLPCFPWPGMMTYGYLSLILGLF